MFLSEDKIYYVYAYLDPRKTGEWDLFTRTVKSEPFYIGKGKGNRINDHLKDVEKFLDGKIKGEYIHRKIYKIINIIKADLDPIIIKVVENLNEKEAFDAEWALIQTLKIIDDGGCLFNYRGGGNGGSLNKESRAKISASLEKYRKANGLWDWENNKAIPHNKGIPMTEEAKENLRRINTGKKASKEVIMKQSVGLQKAWDERGDEIRAKREATRRITKYSPSEETRRKIGKSNSTKTRSKELRETISNTLKNKPLVVCPYCDKEGRGNNMDIHHFDNCPQNPNFDKSKFIICPHCDFVGTNKTSMKIWHFDNCLENPSFDKSKLIACLYCDKVGRTKYSMTRYHFDNCKKKGVTVCL